MEPKELSECRNRLGLTQQGMAGELGISRRRYIYMEQGERKIPRYIELACEALDIHRKITLEWHAKINEQAPEKTVD